MNTKCLQNIIIIMKECYGEDLKDIRVTYSPSNQPYAFWDPNANVGGQQTGSSYTITSTNFSTLKVNATFSAPILIPKCIESTLVSWEYGMDGFSNVSFVIGDEERFEKDLKEELYQMYSNRFDQLIDKLLS